jgi:leucine-rich repeat transmembrane neuronal protein 1/2
MVYNMGTNDHPIGEIGVKVNDNAYHVVRFTRSGANSTIQVDDYNVQTNHPEGNNLSSHVHNIFQIEEWCLVGCYAVWLL